MSRPFQDDGSAAHGEGNEAPGSCKKRISYTARLITPSSRRTTNRTVRPSVVTVCATSFGGGALGSYGFKPAGKLPGTPCAASGNVFGLLCDTVSVDL